MNFKCIYTSMQKSPQSSFRTLSLYQKFLWDWQVGSAGKGAGCTILTTQVQAPEPTYR